MRGFDRKITVHTSNRRPQVISLRSRFLRRSLPALSHPAMLPTIIGFSFLSNHQAESAPKQDLQNFKHLLSGGAHMSTPIAEMPGVLRINDTAPDFTAETTQGTIHFHDWIGTGWAILFSHPKDFTPVCTTELGYMARLQPEFARRNTKIIGLSVDPVSDHSRWARDIEETQGAKVNYPLIGDPQLKIAKLYDMLPADEAGTSEGRTAATNQTVRSVFIIGPDKKIKLMLDRKS